ncbi:thioesterase II family protein [Chitinophaga flava]|uniref:Thioesterase n=1 Tax=Chitinophaga flava TaxID=2259036 RepID=A0A365XUP0_9BACT|nr:alpha/beta fold hydrolase [Chitinophaga flava]RBL90072.1 thioesterase [Chitinophaga flava]
MKKPQLFLLHFAGGNCYSFQFMKPLLHDFEVIALELPGRGRRMDEPLLNDFDAAAKDLYRQIIGDITDAPFLIYGHSMGASLALRVTNLLEDAGKRPVAVIVSGNAGPGLERSRMRYLLDRPEFIKELELLGGLPPEIIENEELFGFFEPVLRADFEIAERNNLVSEPPIQSPLYAVMGSMEENVERIDNWMAYTRGRFASEVLEGDHFFIQRHPHRIAGIISSFYHRMYAMPQS